MLRDLTRRSAAARSLEMPVPITSEIWISDALITHPGESYGVCVSECDQGS